jgi:hypothetical protein
MDDPMDRYIGQSLKNWAASQPLPAKGRKNLLWIASGAAPQRPLKVNKSVLSRSDRDGHFVPLASSRSPADRMIGPLSQPRLWALHVALFPFRALNYA